MQSLAEIRFDDWTLRPKSGELLRDGARIRLQDQPLQILRELLAQPGELVSREQLIARLWPKGVVEFDTALNSAMRRLRSALGDEAETPRYIETIPRRGYRFIGTLTEPPRERRDAGIAVRITAQLIDGATGSRLWSRTYDRDLGALFAVQSEIAAAVANALEVALSERGSAAPIGPQAQRFTLASLGSVD